MMVFVFLFIFLVMVILIFLIHSASTLPSMNPFVKTNPVDRFLHSWVQFIKPVEMVRTAAHHTWRGRVGGFSSIRGLGLWFRWGVEWKNPNCVFIWGGGHFWEDRGVGRLLWKIKDILSNILRATKYSVLREKGQNRAKNTKSSSK